MSSTTTDPAAGPDGAEGRDPRTGVFVVFEGVEGAGKSTQIRRVAERLDAAGVPYVLAREPGGTEVGERARAIVLDPELEMGPEAELFLYLAARAEFVRRIVAPALSRGELVLADRYELSTLAYQGGARGLGIERVREMNRFATGGLAPDLTVLLLIDPDRGRRRQSGTADRLERERSEFHRAVAAAYARLAEGDDRIVTVRTEGSLDRVHERIWAELARRWPAWFPADAEAAGNFSSPDEFHDRGTARDGPHTEAGKAGEGTE